MVFALFLPLVSRGQQIGVRGGDVKGPVEIIADQVEQRLHAEIEGLHDVIVHIEPQETPEHGEEGE